MVASVLKSIREFVYDNSGNRWSDEYLLHLIDEAQKDIAIKTKCLKGSVEFPLVINQELYVLPNNVIQPSKVLLNNCELQIISNNKLHCEPCYEITTGTPTNVLFDKTNRRELRLYPIPSVDTELTVNIGDSDVFGIVTNIDLSPNISSINIKDIYGTITDPEITDKIIKVYYSKLPADIIDENSVLEVDSLYYKAIKYYVCGTLLRNDRDSVSRQTGMDELSLYASEIKDLKGEVVTAFTSGTHYDIEYRRI